MRCNRVNLKWRDSARFVLLCLLLFQGWHCMPSFIPLEWMDASLWDSFLSEIAGYMARALAVLKHTTMNLDILISSRAEQVCKLLEEVSETGILANEWISIIVITAELKHFVISSLNKDIDHSIGLLSWHWQHHHIYIFFIHSQHVACCVWSAHLLLWQPFYYTGIGKVKLHYRMWCNFTCMVYQCI